MWKINDKTQKFNKNLILENKHLESILIEFIMG